MNEVTLENLSASDQKPEAVLQAFSDLNIVLDMNGVILDYKSGPFVQYGFPEITRSRRIQDVFPDDVKEKFERILHTVKQSGNVNAFEYSLSTPDHVRWFDARLAPISKSQLIFTARDITACKETENRLRRQMQQSSALRSIDLAIASGLDLNLLLSLLLDQVTGLLRIDAVSILLLNPKTNMLEFSVAKGFYSNSLQHTHLKLGEGYAGRVAAERKMLNIPDLTQNGAEFNRSPHFAQEHFITYYGVPLIAKGRVLGVLELFHRSYQQPDSDWLDFLILISGQAAIAIDSGLMFKEVQRSNLELSLAYDATIEGLSRALDLRDRKTEEHARRVTDATIGLAVRLGVGGPDLAHIRRGAILHDIGKVAIPDEILFKPGPLMEEEWRIMRQHPGIAVELLSPVAYLAPALDIPHWHHEKWDGTGYPDQLSGNQIPFSARLFALVDVYDALISDRPYRAAWSKQDAAQYIENQSGKHFDPKIVPEFLDLIQRKSI
jgi:HD-GYP domain-containing protein (c-di-GMP phosphodiesterase class II)